MIDIDYNSAVSSLDFLIDNGKLRTGNDYTTLVFVQLFTSNVINNAGTYGGQVVEDAWWGNTYSSYPVGSRLALLFRGKKNGQTINQAKDYVKEGLNPLVTAGVFQSFTVDVTWNAQNGVDILQFFVNVTLPNNQKIQITFGLNPNGTALIIG